MHLGTPHSVDENFVINTPWWSDLASMTWPMCVVDGVLTCLCRTTPLFSPYLALTCGSDSNWFSSTPAAAA